jgi:transposase-like protein
MSHLSDPQFHDEEAAFAEVESLLWPNGPVCPRCGETTKITRVNGKTARVGLRRCAPCKRQFTVTVGTVFGSSHLPMRKWLQAIYLLCSSKMGISSHQLMGILGIQYKSARFLTMRIREATKTGFFRAS